MAEAGAAASTPRRIEAFALIVGALFAALGVALGAFGAHGLRNILDAAALGWWRTAVDYLMWHAVGLLALGAARVPRSAWPARLLALGTLIFSGSLFGMALSGARWLGMVTPVGGLCMIAGWLLFAWACIRARSGQGR